MTKKPKSLRDCALIVRVSIPQWDPKRADPRGVAIVKDATNGHGEVGVFTKYRVPKAEIMPIQQAANAARTYNYAHTLPWQDGGARLLAITMFDEYMAQIDELRGRFTTAVDAFLLRYPNLVNEAWQRLGTLYEPDDYPTAEELRTRFDFRLSVSEISEAPDLRSDLLRPEVLEQLRDDMRRDVEAAARVAQRELWSRMFEIAQRLADTLGQENKIFRNSLVTHSGEILERLRGLNVFDDPEIARVRAELEGVIQEGGKQIDPDRLRHDPEARSEAATKAKASMQEVAGILDKFGL